MLLPTAATASFSSRRLPPPVRTQGGVGAPLLTGAAKFRAPTTRLQRSSSFTFSFSCACSPSPDPTPGDEDSARVLFDEYSDLSQDIPWEPDDIWRTFAAYFLVLHIPLSFGGLGVVAKVLHSSSLDPLTTVASTAMLQLGELTLALTLLQYTAKPHHEVRTFFAGKFSLQRSWVKETALWFGCIMSVVSLTSLLADKLIGPEDAYDHILKEILSDGPTSSLLCFFLYSVIAPLSEEMIYRGFLLTGLSSSMKQRDAVIISSIMFSVAHLSGKSFFQLFIIGCTTGLAYCQTGTLASSFTIHSLYNAVILFTMIRS
ncbi:uncharacterized protein LOC100841614 isoform X2 [Brachypodium distachyon]|uniref:CAAX prenyl protease 2/Lysostaphin resistance protein A-like domain-containing protein n=1 Tax=Brachypodium distachyon TaxID=15368 RepID=I1GUQ8_BRADI|nr:uncharacterized protein LOC100841614 isoform X2 [Brachypodium distachyon]KQK16401.1 hypothetical protein BRADI_1g28580v3 [Brachypodium distachyon]|eukprot:XP_003563167.1 uncharacterized protein LOC100841614 isoform X2 [Brachypodium distachyon]